MRFEGVFLGNPEQVWISDFPPNAPHVEHLYKSPPKPIEKEHLEIICVNPPRLKRS